MPLTDFTIRTVYHDAMVDITAPVQRAVEELGIQDGFLVVFCPHTTAGITINENADPDVMTDVRQQLTEMVPWRQGFFQHDEGNSAAHVKSSMIGCSETIPVQDGQLVLGTWQGVYFAEFDGPRLRTVKVSAVGTFR